MSPAAGMPQRVRARHIDWVDARLSERDRCVLSTVGLLRVTTGKQLQRLCFPNLNHQSQTVVRGRVLARLVTWRVLRIVDRRVGGPQHGSASAIYALDSVGLALARPSAGRGNPVPGARFLAHTLAIAELYAELTDVAAGAADVELAEFQPEPGCWISDGLGGYLKPDAYLQLQSRDLALHWWIEVDRSTESLPTLARKLRTYLGFVERGQLGPHDLVPRVLITVIDQRRLSAVQELIRRLPPPAAALFTVQLDHAAPLALLGYFRE